MVASCVPDKAGRYWAAPETDARSDTRDRPCRAGAARLLQSAYASPTCAWSAFELKWVSVFPTLSALPEPLKPRECSGSPPRTLARIATRHFWRSTVSEHVSHVNDDQFEEQVLKSTEPVLVDFWAEWCGPCKMISPMIDDLAASYQGKLKVAKINIDHNQKTPRNYNVRGIPTLMIFKDGKVEATQIGAISKTQLTQIIDKAIA